MKKIIKTGYLSRVEGEGGITVEIKDSGIVKVHVRIFEAPRFFEALLRGRPYPDVMDFTARICGICPIAYQMSSVHAIEAIFGIEVDEAVKGLRRLLYCGEWIESHALHVYFLHGPDFYGISSAWSDKGYLPMAKRGLLFKKLGNQIITVLGGRPIHPVSVKVGGFYKVPERETLAALLPDLERAFEESIKAILWASSLTFDDNSPDREYVSLLHPAEYPMNYGQVCSSKGLDKSMAAFFEDVCEYQVAYSTALHSGIQRDLSTNSYLAGPLARLNLNHDKLPPDIRGAIRECALSLPMTNTHMGIIARSIEIAYAFHEAIRVIKTYEKPLEASIDCEPRAGTATWITEAPRGMLIHRYEMDEEGRVKGCSIIPPTSQNLAQMERDIRHFIQNNLDTPPDTLKGGCERIIRSYDPCISCSVH